MVSRAPSVGAATGGSLMLGAGKMKVRGTRTQWVGSGPGGASALDGSQPT